MKNGLHRLICVAVMIQFCEVLYSTSPSNMEWFTINSSKMGVSCINLFWATTSIWQADFSHQEIKEFFVSTVRLKLWCLSCVAELLPPLRMQVTKTCCSRIWYLRMLTAHFRNTIPSECDIALGSYSARHHTQRIMLFAVFVFGVPLGAFREPALGIVACSWALIMQMFQ